ncbi:MAG: hypothetical protein IJN13_03905 [Bacilli bacterium]|nr:hypothetical protein [Bacilli bacterium]
MNDFNFDNEIIEISSDDTETTPKFEEVVEEKTKKIKKPKRSLKEKWNDLSKKNKVTIIILSVLMVLLIIGLALYFVFRKDEEEKPIEEPVILEKDNYRYEDGKLVFLDKNEKEIGTYECSDKDTEKCYVAKLNYSNDTFDRIKSVTETGEEIEKNSQIYLDNFVFVYDKGQISLYNIATKESELELKTIKTYGTNKNLVVIEDTDSKYGLIEITEEGYEYLIRCSYDNLGIVNSDLAYLVAQDKDEHYIVDSTGKKLSKNINADISSVNDKYIVAVQNKTYNLYSFEYEELLSDYDYISLHDGVIALIKSNRLYLVNADLNKLHEDGIRLENKDYVKKYVYDVNNKLVETKKSYEIELKDNKAIITIGKDVKEINLAEGEASSKLNYMSYFDGKLYFYSDEEKDDVIGTYTCTNKNNLVNSESTLDNCSLYSNENGISGIYNNEFVFIYDNASKDDAKYYLYNIKEKKTKGTYSSIEIVNNSEMSSNIKQNYTSSSFVIAKSATGDNKGNYGVLEINSEKVAGKVGFKYESITKVKDYYLLINIDKSYSIYNTSFKKISNEFDYIEIFDKYYVGITDNKLNVYAYDNALGILETDLSVTSNKFTIDFTNGFDITIDDVTYSYDKDGHVKEGE